MFCPKCGQTLLLKFSKSGRNELYCVQGEMALSQALRQTFEERYGSSPLPQSSHPPFHSLFHSSLHWFCPGDGEPLNAHLECPRCGKHLRDVVSQLVELHPHKKGKTV